MLRILTVKPPEYSKSQVREKLLAMKKSTRGGGSGGSLGLSSSQGRRGSAGLFGDGGPKLSNIVETGTETAKNLFSAVGGAVSKAKEKLSNQTDVTIGQR